MVFVMMNQIMETAILMVVIVPQPKLQLQELVVATQDGLVIIFVMISITIWTAVMMAETVADAMLTQTGAQYAHALIQMEAGLEQLANLLQQQLIIQVIMQQH